jgi:hypothetical protein
MRYLTMGSAAGAAAILVVWYEASGVVDNYSAAAILLAISCIVGMFVWGHRTLRRP